MRFDWRHAVLAIAFTAGGCDAPQPPGPAVSSAQPAAPASNTLEQVPTAGSDGYAIRLATGQWCTGGPGDVHFNGNAKLCASVNTSTIQIDPERGGPYRLATLKMTYHQPGPATDKGDVVHWNATALRVNCEDRNSIVALSVTTHGEADRELMREIANPPRQFPSPDGALADIVCGPAL